MNFIRFALIACSILFAVSALRPFTTSAQAQGAIAAAVAKPVSLPEIAIGSPKAQVTITEYASMSCPHCAASVRKDGYTRASASCSSTPAQG